MVEERLLALRPEWHQALIVAHGDTANPHVHVIANVSDAEGSSDAAASLR